MLGEAVAETDDGQPYNVPDIACTWFGKRFEVMEHFS